MRRLSFEQCEPRLPLSTNAGGLHVEAGLASTNSAAEIETVRVSSQIMQSVTIAGFAGSNLLMPAGKAVHGHSSNSMALSPQRTLHDPYDPGLGEGGAIWLDGTQELGTSDLLTNAFDVGVAGFASYSRVDSLVTNSVDASLLGGDESRLNGPSRGLQTIAPPMLGPSLPSEADGGTIALAPLRMPASAPATVDLPAPDGQHTRLARQDTADNESDRNTDGNEARGSRTEELRARAIAIEVADAHVGNDFVLTRRPAFRAPDVHPEHPSAEGPAVAGETNVPAKTPANSAAVVNVRPLADSPTGNPSATTRGTQLTQGSVRRHSVRHDSIPSHASELARFERDTETDLAELARDAAIEELAHAELSPEDDDPPVLLADIRSRHLTGAAAALMAGLGMLKYKRRNSTTVASVQMEPRRLGLNELS